MSIIASDPLSTIVEWLMPSHTLHSLDPGTEASKLDQFAASFGLYCDSCLYEDLPIPWDKVVDARIPCWRRFVRCSLPLTSASDRRLKSLTRSAGLPF
jgi:hypothetical protein